MYLDDPVAHSRPDVCGGVIESAVAVPLPQLPDTDAWHITYWSHDTHDRPHVVGGTVIVPTTPYPDGLRPVVAYAASSRGLADRCAPSLLLMAGTDMEASLLAGYLDRGFAVVVSDYEGMGQGRRPTFACGLSEGRAVLDIVRAAYALEAAGLSREAPVAIAGYSQGGHASGWATQLAPTYAPELRVCVAAVGGPPAKFERCREAVDGTIGSAVAALVSIGLDAAYPELDLASSLNVRGRRVMESAYTDDITDFFINNAFLRHDDWVTERAFYRDDWVARGLAQNLGGIRPDVPVLIYHSRDDDVLPYEGAAELYDDWLGLGADVTMIPLEGQGHLETQFSAAAIAADWIASRVMAPTPVARTA